MYGDWRNILGAPDNLVQPGSGAPVYVNQTNGTLSQWSEQWRDKRNDGLRDREIYENRLSTLSGADLLRHAAGETFTFAPLSSDIIPSRWERDPSFSMNEEMFQELTKDLPEVAWRDIYEARSLDHALAIRNHVTERFRTQQDFFNEFGPVTTVGSYLLTGIADPANLVAMGGLAKVYKSLANVEKYSRIVRAARTAPLAMAEAGTLQGIRTAMDPASGEGDVYFALALGGALGGLGGAVAKTRLPGSAPARKYATDGLQLTDQGFDMARADFTVLDARTGFQNQEEVFRYLPRQDGRTLEFGDLTFTGDRHKRIKSAVLERDNDVVTILESGEIRYRGPTYEISGRVNFDDGTVKLDTSTRRAFDKEALAAEIRAGRMLNATKALEDDLSRGVKEMKKTYANEVDVMLQDVITETSEATGARVLRNTPEFHDGEPVELLHRNGDIIDGFGSIEKTGDNSVTLEQMLESAGHPIEKLRAEGKEEVIERLKQTIYRMDGGHILFENMTKENLRRIVERGVYDPNSGQFLMGDRLLAQMDVRSFARMASQDAKEAARQVHRARRVLQMDPQSGQPLPRPRRRPLKGSPEQQVLSERQRLGQIDLRISRTDNLAQSADPTKTPRRVARQYEGFTLGEPIKINVDPMPGQPFKQTGPKRFTMNFGGMWHTLTARNKTQAFLEAQDIVAAEQARLNRLAADNWEELRRAYEADPDAAEAAAAAVRTVTEDQVKNISELDDLLDALDEVEITDLALNNARFRARRIREVAEEAGVVGAREIGLPTAPSSGIEIDLAEGLITRDFLGERVVMTLDEFLNDAEQLEKAVRAETTRYTNRINNEINFSALDDQAPHAIDADEKLFGALDGEVGVGPVLLKFLSTSRFFASHKSRAQNHDHAALRWLAFNTYGNRVGMEMDDGSLRAAIKSTDGLNMQGIEETRKALTRSRAIVIQDLYPLYREWRSLTKRGLLEHQRGDSQHIFLSTLGRIIDDRSGKILAGMDEGERLIYTKARALGVKHWNDELKFLQQYDPDNWKNIKPDDYYFPHYWSEALINTRLSAAKTPEDRGLIRAAMAKMIGRSLEQGRIEQGLKPLSQTKINEMGMLFLENIDGTRFQTSLAGEIFNNIGDQDRLFRFFQREMGQSEAATMELIKDWMPSDPQSKRLMKRARLDTTVTETVTLSTGETMEMSVADLLDFNFGTVAQRYIHDTSSKTLVNDMVRRFNIAIGRPGLFKNLDQILGRVRADGVRLGMDMKELDEHLTLIGKFARGESLNGSQGHNQLIHNIRNTTYGLGAGWNFGISAIPEFMMANFSYGIRNAMASNPIFRDLVGGKISVSAEELRDTQRAIGLGLQERVAPQLSIYQSLYEEGLEGVSLATNAAKYLQGLSRATAEFSGLNPMTSLSDDIALKRAMIYYGNLALNGQTPNSRRLAQMGMDEAMWNDISNEIRRHAKQHGDGSYQLNIEEWSSNNRGIFYNAMQSEVLSMVQRASRTDMPTGLLSGKWMSYDMARLLFQFRSFGISSMSNYLVRNLKARDARALSTLMASVVGGAMSYYLGTKMAVGHDEEEMADRMSPRKFAVGSLMRSGFGATIPDVWNASVGSLVGTDIYGNSHRYGISNSVTDQVSALSYADDVQGMISSFVDTGLLDRRDFTVADKRRVTRVFGFMRHPVLYSLIRDQVYEE